MFWCYNCSDYNSLSQNFSTPLTADIGRFNGHKKNTNEIVFFVCELLLGVDYKFSKQSLNNIIFIRGECYGFLNISSA